MQFKQQTLIRARKSCLRIELKEELTQKSFRISIRTWYGKS